MGTVHHHKPRRTGTMGWGRHRKRLLQCPKILLIWNLDRDRRQRVRLAMGLQSSGDAQVGLWGGRGRGGRAA
jgi:hypothetical protein